MVTHSDWLSLWKVLQTVDYAQDCQHEGTHCQLWFESFLCNSSQHLAVRDGNSLVLNINRASLPANWRPPLLPDPPGAEGLPLLQTKSRFSKSTTPQGGEKGDIRI